MLTSEFDDNQAFLRALPLPLFDKVTREIFLYFSAYELAIKLVESLEPLSAIMMYHLYCLLSFI